MTTTELTATEEASASQVLDGIVDELLVALSSLPNSELSTIELLDGAHSAGRALIALQDRTSLERRQPATMNQTGSVRTVTASPSQAGG